MNRLFAGILAVGILFTLFSGCADRSMPDNGPDTPSQTEEEAPEIELTPEEINAQINPADVHLVQQQVNFDGMDAVSIRTTAGEFQVVLFREQAPKAVENFFALVRENYYDGMGFHRVINNFLVQTGDPGDGSGGRSSFTDESGNAVSFDNEFHLDLWHFRGALSMYNTGEGTNASQFFIVQAPYVGESQLGQMEQAGFPQKVIDTYADKGGIPGYDWRYTVFGMVIGSGMDVVDAIARIPTGDDDRPEDPVLIESITILNELQPAENTGIDE